MTSQGRRFVVLAAGGTGGHVFPASALAAELTRRNVRLALLTDRRGDGFGGFLDSVETYHIAAGGIAGKSPWRRAVSLGKISIGVLQSLRLLRRLLPDAVVGFGGYAAVPSMLAASQVGLRTVIHEQNAVLGRANRLLAPRVMRIATSFESPQGVPTAARDKIRHTGMPIRPAVAQVRGQPYPVLRTGDPIRLLVLGGSQGARVLSNVVPAAIAEIDPALRARLRIAQHCRPEDIERVRAAYGGIGVAAELSAFFDDVPERLAAAHLLIARAGASTVAEITTVGRPAILVPFRHAIDDHQTVNAQAIDNAGAGWLIPEPTFTPATLSSRLASLFTNPITLETAAACSRAAGRPDAAVQLADVVAALIGSNGSGGKTDREQLEAVPQGKEAA